MIDLGLHRFIQTFEEKKQRKLHFSFKFDHYNMTIVA